MRRRHSLRAPDFVPRVGIVLGSGLGDYADQVQTVAAMSYGDLPGFPAPGVAGHAGRLIIGRIAGRRSQCCKGVRTITSTVAPKR